MTNKIKYIYKKAVLPYNEDILMKNKIKKKKYSKAEKELVIERLKQIPDNLRLSIG